MASQNLSTGDVVRLRYAIQRGIAYQYDINLPPAPAAARPFLAGSGSPQGAVAATPGTTYWDTTGKGFYVKDTGVGNTGWVQLIPTAPTGIGQY